MALLFFSHLFDCESLSSDADARGNLPLFYVCMLNATRVTHGQVNGRASSIEQGCGIVPYVRNFLSTILHFKSNMFFTVMHILKDGIFTDGWICHQQPEIAKSIVIEGYLLRKKDFVLKVG